MPRRTSKKHIDSTLTSLFDELAETSDVQARTNRKVQTATPLLLSIDPGANLGWALFQLHKTRKGAEAPKAITLPGILVACGFRTLPQTFDGTVERAVIERPHTGRTKASAKDILTLAIRAGEAGGWVRARTGTEVEYVEPVRWKGNWSKEITKNVVEGKLMPEELEVLKGYRFSKSAKHNVIDAIGIGLFALRRLF